MKWFTVAVDVFPSPACFSDSSSSSHDSYLEPNRKQEGKFDYLLLNLKKKGKIDSKTITLTGSSSSSPSHLSETFNGATAAGTVGSKSSASKQVKINFM